MSRFCAVGAASTSTASLSPNGGLLCEMSAMLAFLDPDLIKIHQVFILIVGSPSANIEDGPPAIAEKIEYLFIEYQLRGAS
jgi:hypothetical protein